MAEMMDTGFGGTGGAGAGWLEYLRRFAGSKGGMGQGIGAAVGSENSESIGQMYDQLMKPPVTRPMAAPPTMALQPAAPINFAPGSPGGIDQKTVQLLMQLLKQRGV